MITASGIANDIIDLHFTAGAHTARALDAGIQVDGNGGMTEIGLRLRPASKPRLAQLHLLRPVVQLGIGAVRGRLGNHLRRGARLGHVREQQFQHHLLRLHRTRTVAGDFHAGTGSAAARGSQGTLALDFHHAGAAVAIGAQTVLVAKVWNLHPVRTRCLQDALPGRRIDALAVEHELHRHGGLFVAAVCCHGFTPSPQRPGSLRGNV